MTGLRDHLTHFVEKETQLHVVLGDDAIYNVRGVGNSTFQLDSSMQLQLKEVLYVPCYPRYLGITRRSCLEAHMVLDMEYRERD
jgi:hypothetical protein